MYTNILKGAISATPLFLFLLTRLTKLLIISTKKYLITKGNSFADCRTVYEVRKQSNKQLKTYAFLLEDKMVAGAFGSTRN